MMEDSYSKYCDAREALDRGDEDPRAPQPAESKQKAARQKILFVMG